MKVVWGGSDTMIKLMFFPLAVTGYRSERNEETKVLNPTLSQKIEGMIIQEHCQPC